MRSDEAGGGEGVDIGDEADGTLDATVLARQIVSANFDEWYRRHRFTQNIRNGQPYFNGPPNLKPPARFSASDLLKCHRKIHYKHRNAPEESEDPRGIFYFGEKFEEDLAEQFLEESITAPEIFIRNSVWVNATVSTEVGTITLVGSTDPTATDEEGDVILLTEMKTSSSIEYLAEPKEHHLAQAHAYMHALSQQQEREVRDVVFIYAGRDTLDVKIFHETFDEQFWESRLVKWMKHNTYYRVLGLLPPAEPEQDWECDFCPYRGRCGQTNVPYQDEDAAGFLPLHTEYPREKVKEYLETHDAAKLTPSLAQEYPDLAERHGAFDWECNICTESFRWDSIAWDGRQRPVCPNCEDDGRDGRLKGPEPEDQHHIEVVDRRDDQ